MMRWIVGSSLRAKRGVVLVAALLFGFGVWQLRDASMDALPEFSPTTVEVQTEALGLSAEEMEQLITVPLEQDLLNGVAWMETIRSQSVPGLSSIVMEFEPGTDLYRARQVVQERLNEAHALPNVSKVPAMLQPQSSTSRAMMISLSSEELTPIQLGVLARWNIVPRLTGVQGVSNVVIWGQKERQLQVLVDPQRLTDSDVTLDQVISTTGNALWASPLSFLEASTPGTGGFIDMNNQRLGVQHLSPIKTADELAQVVIEQPQGATGAGVGAPVRLGDVAEVVEDHQPLIGDALVDGGEGLILVVEKLPNTDTKAVTEGVEDAIDSLRPGLEGVEIDTGIYRPATYIDNAGGNLFRSVLIGGVLLLIGLLAFVLSWRRALIMVVAIAFSLLAAGLVLYWRESSFNLIVIAGLIMALGAVVDDAISSVDNTARRLRQGAAEGGEALSALGVILEASLETARSLGYSLAAMVLALLPLFVMEGLAGDSFYPPLAISFLLAVVVAFLVALTVTPALSLLLLSRAAPDERDSPVISGLAGLYGRLVAPVVRRPLPVAIGGVVVAVLGVATFTQLDRSVLPALKETDLLVQWSGAPGTSLPEMNRVIGRAAEEIRALPGVENADAHVGRAIAGDQVGGTNTGELWVSVDPEADYDDAISSIEEVVSGYPGLDHEVRTYSGSQISDVLASDRKPVRVRLYGQELDVLQEKADEIGTVLAGIDGATNVDVERTIVEPTIEIEVDLPAAQEAGIKPGDVRRAATTLVSGIQVGALFEEQKIFEVQVWGVPEVRGSVSDIENLALDLPDGGTVRMGDVANVRIGSSPASINHDATSRSLDITADVSGRGAGAVAKDLEEQLAANVEFPLEYHTEILGDFQDRQGAERRLMFYAIGAALGIFLLFQAAFSSWRVAAVAFLSLLVALTGGAIAAWIDGGTITLATVAGLLAVLAVAIRQTLMLVGRFQHLEREAGLALDRELVDRGAQERFGPIVTAVAVTALALLPIVIAGSIAGQEIVKPMAVVVIGGLITTLVVSLFVVPALYLRVARPMEPEALSFASDSDIAHATDDRESVGAATFSWPAPSATPSPTEG